MKIFGYIVLAFLGLALLTFGANEFEIFGARFWGVRKENARHEVFEQTQSYVEGKRQDLLRYYNQYQKASTEDKEALKSVIQMQFANVKDDLFLDTPQLHSFLMDMKY